MSLHVDLLLFKKSWNKAEEMSDQPTIEQSKECHYVFNAHDVQWLGLCTDPPPP